MDSTPLHLAAFHGWEEIVSMLLAVGATDDADTTLVS
jgi:ankyrin repeat protein